MGSTMEAIAEHYVGKTLQNWLQEPWIVAGVIFEIRVLNEDNVSSGVLKPGAQSCAFALIAFMQR